MKAVKFILLLSFNILFSPIWANPSLTDTLGLASLKPSQSLRLDSYNALVLPNSEGEGRFVSEDLDLHLKTKLNHKTNHFQLGLQFSYLNLSYSDVTVNTTEHFFRFGLLMAYRKDIGTWHAAFTLKPNLASDFKNKFNKDMFFSQAEVELSKSISPHTEIGLGICYYGNHKNGSPSVLPQIIIKYKKGPWFVSGNFPGELEGFYKIKDSYIGCFASYQDQSYEHHIEHSFFKDYKYLRIRKLLLGPKYRYKFISDFYFDISLGIVLFNQLESYDTQNSNFYNIESKERLAFKFSFQFY